MASPPGAAEAHRSGDSFGPTQPPWAAQLAKSGWICYSDSPAKRVPLSHHI